ncbi:MAG: radical SAM protein [Clostridia bacterium]|nr:radical SAM protein [Clostridia bacterium]
MAHRLNGDHIRRIKNPAFAAYAMEYQRIYDDFMENVKGFGLPFARDREEEIEALRKELRALGVISRNDGASLANGAVCGACEACRTGADSYTGLISLMCHRNCFFCFNPNQSEYARYADGKKDWEAELEQVYAQKKDLRYIALTGGEPLLHKRETIAYFEKAKRLWPDVSMRLYTSGDLLDQTMIEELARVGLEEIRFSLKLEDEPALMEKVYAAMEAAKKYIPRVMVEMPVLPDREQEMLDVLDRLESMGIFGINLLELCFPFENARAFSARGYALRNPPYKTLYNFWYAGGLPVDGSELLALKLLAYVMRRGYKLVAHYCSLENKHFGQIYMQNTGADAGECFVMSRKDFYLKTVKAFGKDAARAERILREHHMHAYEMDRENGFIQMSPACAALLRGTGMELAVSYQVREMRENAFCLRELRLDYVKAAEFDESML